MNKLGFICAATTHEYVRLAYAMALSMKLTKQCFGLSIIVSDKKHVLPQWEPLFESIIEIKQPQDTTKFYQRSHFYDASPYKHTIALDADMIFTRNLDKWWPVLCDSCKPIVMPEAITYKGDKITDRRFRKVFDDATLPDAYSACFYFDKSERSKEFFELLNSMFLNWGIYAGMLPTPYDILQPATTDVAMALALRILKFDDAFTGWLPKFVHFKPELQNVKEIESLAAPKIISSPGHYWDRGIRSLVSIERINQSAPVHYFNKEWMTEENLTLLEESYKCLT